MKVMVFDTAHKVVDDRVDGAVEVAEPVWHQRQRNGRLVR